MRRQQPVGPFDGLSPIRHREVLDSRSRLQESIEILEIQEQSSQSVQSRRSNMHRPERHSPEHRRHPKSTLPEILSRLLVNRVRYSFQLLLQFFLFSDSESSMKSGQYNLKPYFAEIEEGFETLEDFVVRQDVKSKVMAFQYIRAISSGKNHSTNYESHTSLLHMHRIISFTQSIDRVFKQLTERTLTAFYERVRAYADRQKSKILTPVLVDDGAQTARRRTQSIASGKTSSYAQSQQLESKQYIYIVKSKSKILQSEQLSRKKPTFVKVPLLSNNVEINEISLMNSTPHLVEHKVDRPKHKRHVSNRQEFELNMKHEACTSCQYCSTIRELNELCRADFSKKKSVARLDLRSERKR